ALAGSHPAGAHARIAAAVAECAKLGIAALPPDVNASQANFALERQGDGAQAIRFGLQQIKNVGAGAAESIAEERSRNGPYAAIEDFCRRVNLKSVNKRALESLTKSGVLGAFGDRGTLLANLDRLVALAQREQRLRETGQSTMFDLFGDQVATPMPGLELEEAPVLRAEELAWEKELLGVYVSEHPFQAAASVLAPHVTALCAELAEAPQAQQAAAEGEPAAAAAPLPAQGREATLAGMVGNTRRLYTRDGRPFCAAEIEDLSGTVEVTVWPELFEKTQELWMEGNIVLLEVKARERNGRHQIAVQQVELYQAADGASASFVPPAWLTKEQGNGIEPRTQNLEPRTSSPQVGLQPDDDQPPKVGLQPDNDRPKPVPQGEPATSDQPAAVATATRTDGPAATRPTLRIQLRETEDEIADRDRLQRLLAVLRDFPGEDGVRLTVRSLDGGTHPVALSLRVSASDKKLASRLREVLSDAGEAKVVG
ncbi:MAG: OB-fold nucleic acid binding domain-containing protein, partial [Dehalococcoidia bacterium]|nr:OB-fold nucleic acid binding domain-containing protein [Dehalococcoidia bacterium]